MRGGLRPAEMAVNAQICGWVGSYTARVLSLPAQRRSQGNSRSRCYKAVFTWHAILISMAFPARSQQQCQDDNQHRSQPEELESLFAPLRWSTGTGVRSSGLGRCR